MARRVPRFRCKASAEITADGTVEVANVTELSRYGCFVQTPTPLATGTSLAVKIMNQGQIFAATAMVVYTQPDIGMGIAFREVKSLFQGLLEDWLGELLEKRGGAVN
ncbi:MAG TPA: PilZ domain-containing protein [Candidatus Acidoferrum sp.]